MRRWGFIFVLVIFFSFLYFSLQSQSIYGGDGGDFASAVATRGIPHPPGYPLFTALGITLETFIPGATVAWKMAFLSSVFGVLSLSVLHFLLLRFKVNSWASFISVTALGVTYPFWLYSEVVEVFSLNAFFLIILVYCAVAAYQKRSRKFLYLVSFLFGLSLTHHQTIVFLLPSFIFLLTQDRRAFTKRTILFSSALFILGFFPYVYVLVSARHDPAVNWMGEATWRNFAALVTRATYGTFRAGGFTGHDPYLRILDIAAFAEFAYFDFRLFGIFTATAGIMYLFFQRRILFIFFGIAFLAYLFFLFYASFPIADSFLLGTYERFILPLYIFIAIFITFGLTFLFSVIGRILNKLSPNLAARTLPVFLFLFIIYPIALFLSNYPKLSLLRDDFTAENLGDDILATADSKSILILSTDTPLFNTQYIYYTKRKWPGVILIHLSKIYTSDYQRHIKRLHPDIIIPEQLGSPQEFFEEFISENAKKFPIFSKLAFSTFHGKWIPWGLLFRYSQEENLAAKQEEIVKINEELWANYYDPTASAFMRYGHLIGYDTLRVYAISHQETGFFLAKHSYFEKAEKHLLAAEKLYAADTDSYTILAQVYIKMRRCTDAESQIQEKIRLDSDDASGYLVASYIYSGCFNDPKKAAQYASLFEEKRRMKETQLKSL